MCLNEMMCAPRVYFARPAGWWWQRWRREPIIILLFESNAPFACTISWLMSSTTFLPVGRHASIQKFLGLFSRLRTHCFYSLHSNYTYIYIEQCRMVSDGLESSANSFSNNSNDNLLKPKKQKVKTKRNQSMFCCDFCQSSSLFSQPTFSPMPVCASARVGSWWKGFRFLGVMLEVLFLVSFWP